jgi:hypothetical protein
MPLLTLPQAPRFSTLGAIIMDESGSMARFGTTPSDSLGEYLDDLRESPDAPAMGATIVTFSSSARVRLEPTPVPSAPRKLDYGPSGGTRLYGTTLDVLASLLNHRRSFHLAVVTVITDGEDNRSQESERLRLVELSGEARALGWELLVFGLGVDARAIARRMGFSEDPERARTVAAVADEIRTSVSRSSHVTRVTAVTSRGSWGEP